MRRAVSLDRRSFLSGWVREDLLYLDGPFALALGGAGDVQRVGSSFLRLATFHLGITHGSHSVYMSQANLLLASFNLSYLFELRLSKRFANSRTSLPFVQLGSFALDSLYTTRYVMITSSFALSTILVLEMWNRVCLSLTHLRIFRFPVFHISHRSSCPSLSPSRRIKTLVETEKSQGPRSDAG